MWIAAASGDAAAAWGPSRDSGHERLSPPALLAFGAVPLLVTLLATNEILVVLVPTVPFCFHPSGLGTLASVGFVSSIAL